MKYQIKLSIDYNYFFLINESQSHLEMSELAHIFQLGATCGDWTVYNFNVYALLHNILVDVHEIRRVATSYFDNSRLLDKS